MTSSLVDRSRIIWSSQEQFCSFHSWAVQIWRGTAQSTPLQVIILFHYNDIIMSTIASQNLLNRLFRRRSKETPKLRTTGLCAENSPVTGEFPADRASNAETVSVRWRLHVCKSSRGATTCFYLDTRHTRLIIRVKSRGLGYMIFLIY